MKSKIKVQSRQGMTPKAGLWGLEFCRGKKIEESVRYGVGVGLGEFFGISSKFALGIVIWFVVAVAAFWP